MSKENQTYPFIHAVREAAFCGCCGAEITPQSEFCTRCGKRIVLGTDPESTVRFCTGCGNSVAAVSHFCPYCGKNLRPAGTGDPPGDIDERFSGLPEADMREVYSPPEWMGKRREELLDMPEADMREVYGPPEWMGRQGKKSTRLPVTRMAAVYAPPDLMGRGGETEPDSEKSFRKNLLSRLFGKKQDEE